MPQIRQYEAPALSISPSEIGTNAAANAARRIGGAYNEAAGAVTEVGNQFARNMGEAVRDVGEVVVKYAEHREVSHGAAAFAQLQDGLTQKWNETAKTADPNDPAVAERFRQETLEPALEKYKDAFMTEGGQKFAERHVESLRSHMFQKTAADMSSLAAQAVSVNMRQTLNSLSNTANTDPSSVPELLKNVDGMVDGMITSAPNLKGADASRARMELTQKMKEDIVKSGVIGAIARAGNPEGIAEAWGKKYPEYISGAELKQLAANERQQIRARRTDEAYGVHLEEKKAQKASDDREVQYLQRLHSDDQKEAGSVSTRSIVNDPVMSRAAKERMIGIVNREMKPETAAQVSAGTTTELLDRMRRPEGDPDRIADLGPVYDAMKDGKLNKTDFKFLRDEFTQMRTPEGQRLGDRKQELLKAVTPMIDKSNPLMGKVDQDGAMNRYRFQMDLEAKVAEYRAAGKDPYSLFDPSKPDFFGRAANVATYQKPLSQSVRDISGRLTNRPAATAAPTGEPAAPPPAAKVEPRKPGESAADYLKRTGNR